MKVVLHAAAAAAVVVGAVILASPGDLWLAGVTFHPGWVAVAVLAARYGVRGLFLGLGFVVGALTVADVLLYGADGDGVLLRIAMPDEVMVLAAVTMVAWISMLQESRAHRVAMRLEDTEAQLIANEEVMAVMRDSLTSLRERADRIDLSLTVLRDLAARIEHGDAIEAARAALELCTLRVGAPAGLVQRWDGTSLRTLTWRGTWSGADSRPRDIFTDRTAAGAVHRGRPALRSQIENTTTDDSDVAVPILGERDEVLGVLALRGLPPGRPRAADVRDLVIAAQWLAPALSRQAAEPVRESARMRAVAAAEALLQ
jgi:hypothetical protein